MLEILYHLIFLIFTIFVLIEVSYYSVYEIKNLNNKLGGISLIVFTVLCVVFSNIIIFVK